MPEFILEGTHAPEYKALDAFTQGYIEALFFTDSGPEDGQLGDAGFSDLAAEALADIVRDCSTFQTANAALLAEAYTLDYGEAQAGRDFWFTRCGHGVGYWDREALDCNKLDGLTLGDRLTTPAHAAGNVDTYLGDDGKVYHG
jgi:hypothetical protein